MEGKQEKKEQHKREKKIKKPLFFGIEQVYYQNPGTNNQTNPQSGNKRRNGK